MSESQSMASKRSRNERASPGPRVVTVPRTSTTFGSANGATIARTQPRGTRQSESVVRTIAPRPARRPRATACTLGAHRLDGLRTCTRRTRGSTSAAARTTSAVSSVERSSTT